MTRLWEDSDYKNDMEAAQYWMRRAYRARISNGVCSKCVRDAEPNTTMCRYHLDRNSFAANMSRIMKLLRRSK